MLISSNHFASIEFLSDTLGKFFSANELKKLANFNIEDASKITKSN